MVISNDRVFDFQLPGGTTRVEGVFVNGVRQVEGRDYLVDGRRLRFLGSLRRRSEIGLTGWILTALCASVEAGGDSVDAIVVTPNGRSSVSLQPA
jgi:hypothetical protein